MVSQKKAQANRANCRKSSGPVSPMGKARMRLNALRHGFYAKEVVIEAAGETQLEFNALRTQVWDYFQPQNVMGGMLVDELVITYWRLQRPRRGETAEIRRQCDTARWRRQLEKVTEVDSLKSRFLLDLDALCLSELEPTDPTPLVLSLEETRKLLERKSLGLEFLIELTQGIGEQVKEQGYLSPMNEKLLVGVCGINDTAAKACLLLNHIAKTELEKFKNDCSADRRTFERNQEIMLMRLKGKIQDLGVKKQITTQLEAAEEEAFLASLVVLPAERSEKIHRAEAALERRYFKTLKYLLALQGVEIPS